MDPVETSWELSPYAKEAFYILIISAWKFHLSTPLTNHQSSFWLSLYESTLRATVPKPQSARERPAVNKRILKEDGTNNFHSTIP